jgi:hypothetical protein
MNGLINFFLTNFLRFFNMSTYVDKQLFKDLGTLEYNLLFVGLSEAKPTSLVVKATPGSEAFIAQLAKELKDLGFGVVMLRFREEFRKRLSLQVSNGLDKIKNSLTKNLLSY